MSFLKFELIAEFLSMTPKQILSLTLLIILIFHLVFSYSDRGNFDKIIEL